MSQSKQQHIKSSLHYMNASAETSKVFTKGLESQLLSSADLRHAAENLTPKLKQVSASFCRDSAQMKQNISELSNLATEAIEIQQDFLIQSDTQLRGTIVTDRISENMRHLNQHLEQLEQAQQKLSDEAGLQEKSIHQLALEMERIQQQTQDSKQLLNFLLEKTHEVSKLLHQMEDRAEQSIVASLNTSIHATRSNTFKALKTSEFIHENCEDSISHIHNANDLVKLIQQNSDEVQNHLKNHSEILGQSKKSASTLLVETAKRKNHLEHLTTTLNQMRSGVEQNKKDAENLTSFATHFDSHRSHVLSRLTTLNHQMSTSRKSCNLILLDKAGQLAKTMSEICRNGEDLQALAFQREQEHLHSIQQYRAQEESINAARTLLMTQIFEKSAEHLKVLKPTSQLERF